MFVPVCGLMEATGPLRAGVNGGADTWCGCW